MSQYISEEQGTTTSAPIIPEWSWVKADWRRLLAFGFGSGLSRRAPGTVGTLVAIPLYILLLFVVPNIFIFALSLPLFALGVWVCERVGEELGVVDHGGIVWDEIVAFLLVLSMVMNQNREPLAWLLSLGLAFGLFRFFDIVKPFPIRTLERRIHGGLGIMIDDMFAAVYTVIVFHVLWYGAGHVWGS